MGFGDLRGSAPAMGEIQDLLRRGRKIDAIKVYRERTGLGLKEAKDAVEEIERGLR
jgi:ribosomal protein L7/L12